MATAAGSARDGRDSADHIVRVRAGGSDDLVNLRAAHWSGNRRRGWPLLWSSPSTTSWSRRTGCATALYDLLIDHKAEFGYGAHDPIRHPQRPTQQRRQRAAHDRRRVGRARQRAAGGPRPAWDRAVHAAHAAAHVRLILAELNLPPRWAMYLIGHTDPTLTMRVYQQVIDMGEGGLETLEKLIGCTLEEAFALLSGRGVLATNWQPANKMPPSPVRGASWKARKRRSCRWFFEAAEGTRTLDLLHGKQTSVEPVDRLFTCKSR
jgi:hypothetical protein